MDDKHDLINTVKKNSPFFSIVTVVKDDLQGLKDTFESLQSQTIEDYEWVVVDGESGDETIGWLKSLNNKGVRFISESDSGIYDAMNKGISLSSGKYTLFLNAGDIFATPDVLNKVRNVITNHSRVDVLCGGATLLFENGKKWYRKPKNIESYIWHGLAANHQATYYLTDLLKDNKYDLKYKYCGDYYIAAVLYLKSTKVAYLDKSLTIFRVGDTSYKAPFQLIREAYLVQKNVLKKPLLLRIISALKRAIAISMTKLINLV